MPDILCPTCGAALTLGSRQWLCPKGHCFDVARQGYVNLLPVTQKHSLHPGDTREQVVAAGPSWRRGFMSPWPRPCARRLGGMGKTQKPFWTLAVARAITARR